MSWERLLSRLDPDPERAAREFERLRAALVRLLDWRGAPWPEDAADETLARLARRLEETEGVVDVAAFAHGIARRVLQELTRSESRLVGLDGIEPAAAPAPEEPPIAAALDACLEELEAPERELVIAYYAGGDGRKKLDARRHLAEAAGISPGALRSRVQRIRDRLERCVRGRHGSPPHRTKDGKEGRGLPSRPTGRAATCWGSRARRRSRRSSSRCSGPRRPSTPSPRPRTP